MQVETHPFVFLCQLKHTPFFFVVHLKHDLLCQLFHPALAIRLHSILLYCRLTCSLAKSLIDNFTLYICRRQTIGSDIHNTQYQYKIHWKYTKLTPKTPLPAPQSACSKNTCQVVQIHFCCKYTRPMLSNTPACLSITQVSCF